MRPDEVAALFGHLSFLRDRILAAADDPSVDLDAAGSTLRTLRQTLVHELDVEWSWRKRLRGPDPTRFSPDDEELDPADFATVAAIRERWLADEREMRDWLATLDEVALDGPCRAERDRSHPLWFHLQHLYSHGLQQLADAATILTAAGRSPGELDFLEYVEAVLDRPRPALDVRPLTEADRAWAAAILDAELAGSVQARRGELIDVLDDEGLVAWRGDERVGLATFRDDGPGRIELSAIATATTGQGVGSALVLALADEARSRGIREVRATTTNDNLDALAFYQRRGFVLAELRAGAVERSRASIKPGIPELAGNGLPIRDEIELVLVLDPPGPGA
jgi:ribosomal protein S18 acetylase RimI-like enzyme